MASRFVRQIFQPAARRFARQMGEDFTSTVVQDQYEQATGATVRTPPPSSAGGFLGTVLGTLFNGAVRNARTAVPPATQQQTLDRYNSQVDHLMTTFQRQARLRQLGMAPDRAAEIDRALTNNTTTQLEDPLLRQLSSSVGAADSSGSGDV